ncbi:MAG TPA: SsrA-binding protein SmpB [Patescibacteria group bacterium]
MPTVAVNKRANFDYTILETYEAGLVLTGQEVKSIKAGQLSLKGSYVVIKKNEAWLINSHLPPYKMAGKPEGYDPDRNRKLLLHKKEIKTLIGKSQEQGLTLVPLKVYTKRNQIKLEFAVARGKKKIDKRELIKKREIQKKIKTIRKN